MKVNVQETAEGSRAGYWRRFESTGRVEDYLKYSCAAGMQETIRGKSGADPYAGFYHSDGNDIETDAYR